MEERSIQLKNTNYRYVIFVIEEALGKIPRPAYIDENPSNKSITQYYFQEPIRTESYEKQVGRIAITYSQTKIAQFGIMAGLVFEREPIVFECFQGKENNTVEVKGICSPKIENETWIKPIFDNVWKQLLDCFSS